MKLSPNNKPWLRDKNQKLGYPHGDIEESDERAVARVARLEYIEGVTVLTPATPMTHKFLDL